MPVLVPLPVVCGMLCIDARCRSTAYTNTNIIYIYTERVALLVELSADGRTCTVNETENRLTMRCMRTVVDTMNAVRKLNTSEE